MSITTRELERRLAVAKGMAVSAGESGPLRSSVDDRVDLLEALCAISRKDDATAHGFEGITRARLDELRRTFCKRLDREAWDPESRARVNAQLDVIAALIEEAGQARDLPRTIADYSRRARATAAPGKDAAYWFTYSVLGLCGEAGEFAEKVKKAYRNSGARSFDDLTDEERRRLLDELGDVLWYVNEIAFQMGSSLEEVARMNNEKLEDRATRGVIRSEGDER